jgi:hypothetical protein
VHEIALGRVATGKAAALPRLLPELVDIQLAVLLVPVVA